MSEYLTSSNFGKFAGSILSQRKEDYKKRFQRAIGFDFVKNFVDQAKTGLIQDKEDSINDILSDYDSIFKINQEEFNQFDRKKINEYVKDKDIFLNKEAASKINNSNFAIENNVTWENRMNEDENIQSQLINTFNSIREEIDNEYKIKQTNPKYTIKTLEQYNAPAKKELIAALSLANDDPRTKTLFKKIFNNTFRRRKDPDGNLVSTNPEVIELEDNLMVAKVNRNTFRQRVEDADIALEEYYQNLTNTPIENLETIIKKQTKSFTEKELEDKTKNTINYFIDSKGNFTDNFGNIPLIINIKGKDKKEREIINSIDIKQKIRKNQVKVLDENGEVEPLSMNMLYEAIALRRLYMAFEIEQKKENPLVGPTAIHAAIESFNKNGRFKVDGSNIIFTLPGTNIKNSIDADDAAALTQQNGKSKDEVPSGVLSDEEQIQRYSVVNVLNFIEDLRLQGKSEEEINLAANNIKQKYNNINISNEVDIIVNSTKKEFLKLKKLELEQFAKSSFLKRQFPENIFTNELGTTSDIDKLLGE